MTVAVTFDPSGDYAVWDNLKSANFESAHDGSNVPDFLPVVKFRALNKKEQFATGGVYEGFWKVALVPVKTSPQITIKPADVIVDSDQSRWTVQTADLNTWGTWWRCSCLNLVLALELRDMIDVERADVSIDPSGAYIKSFPSEPPFGGRLLYSQVPARVQAQGEEVHEARGIRGETDTLRIIVAKQINVDVAEDRVRWVDKFGIVHYFDILHYQNADRIDELPYLEVADKL